MAHDHTRTRTTFGDRTVSRVGLGVMQLAPHDPASAPDRSDALRLLRTAIAHGVDHLDTAQFYGDGLANELIHEALAPYPPDLTVVSKVGAELRAGELVAAQQPAQLRAQVEQNLRGLGADRLAAVNLRRLDAAPGLVATGDQVVPLEDQLAELIALRDEGLIEQFGLSNVDADQLRAALPAQVVCVQNAHSLLDRSAEPVLDLCREHDLAWIPFFPLGSAFPGVAKVTQHPEVEAIAVEVGATPAQVGLAWELAHYAGTALIPGTASVEHLHANLGAGAVSLPPDALIRLDAIAA